MSEHDSGRAELSAAGQSRRAEILGIALAVSASRRRRRIAGRSLGVAAPLALVAVVAWGVQQRPSPVPTPNETPVVAAIPRLEPSRSAIRMVATNPGLVSRWSAPERSLAATRLNDSELFSILAGEGRATGMVRAGNTVTVVGLTPDDQPKPSGQAPAAAPIIYAGVYGGTGAHPAREHRSSRV